MEDDLHFGAVEVRAAQRQVLVDGRPAAIGARAFDVLLVLLEHRDRVVTKEELIGKVWEGRIVEENNLQVQIGALRKLLGVGAIATIPGRGYRFVAQPDAGGPPKVTDATEEAGRGLAAGLPKHRTLFFGRDREKRQALAALRDHSLFTLIGIGRQRQRRD
jgi:DNA-binding winged helix-turn-helix (wHTH) protein